MNERGSVLIACAILSLLLVAMVVWYWQWSWHSSVEQVNRFSGKTAMQYADSGMQAAAIQLRSPDLKQFLDVGTTNVITQPMTNGRFEVALYRQGLDPNLVDTYTTGYFYLSNGSIVDPQTNQRAQWAVINAKFRIANVAQFLAALPGNLQISYGTNAANGTVYAKDLTFASGPCGAPGETRVGAALYFNSVSPSPAPCFVNFTANPANAQRQSYPPNFARLDATLRAFYQSHATTQPLPAPFSGAVAAPSDFPVYSVNGPLDIAQCQPLTVQALY